MDHAFTLLTINFMMHIIHAHTHTYIHTQLMSGGSTQQPSLDPSEKHRYKVKVKRSDTLIQKGTLKQKGTLI